MFDGCMYCPVSGSCCMDPYQDQCDYLLEHYVNEAKADYYSEWLSYIEEYSDT